jgi:hypothetical protein
MQYSLFRLSNKFVLKHVTKFAYKDKYNNRKGYHQITFYPSNQYIMDKIKEVENINIYFKSYLLIDNSDTSIPWEMRQSIMITDYTIHKLVKGLKKVKKWFKAKKYDDLYYLEDGLLKLNKEMASNMSYDIALEYDKSIKIIPAVINDSAKSYEGVLLFINNIDNYCELSINEIKALHYKLKKMNLYEAGLMMLNFLGKDKDAERNGIQQLIENNNYNSANNNVIRNRADNQLQNDLGGWFK